jgi:asparagine synthase (glutamine-hydrolysing)
MCGIAGIVKYKNSTVDIVSAAIAMNNAIRHRGPDGEGFLAIKENEEICLFGKDTRMEIASSSILQRPVKSITECNDATAILAHRRLKIIDITPTGHQPMCNTDKSMWITYNGEIYNYIELREELKKSGYSFHTTSDTEVILAAYAKWGNDCVNHFNGMWSFVIYNKQKKTLFASRDRFGVKPFYYIKNENCFAFASEQKALLASGLVQFKPNNKAIFDYLVFLSMESEEEGMFTGILELMPSHSMEVNLHTGELKKWRYYSLPFSNEYDRKGFNREQCVEKIKDLITDAVKLRLRADVEVGSCLSGGMDSSSIVGIINQTKHSGLNTFTVSFDDPEFNEGNWAKIVSDYVHSNVHLVTPKSEELVRDLRNLIYCQDIPIWSTSTYAQYRVMQLIKEANIKVVLDGQGGDEMFAGYENYFFYHLEGELKNNGRSSFKREIKEIGDQYPVGREFFKRRVLAVLPSGIGARAKFLKHQELPYLKKDFIAENKYRLQLHQDKANSLNEALHNDFSGLLLKSYLKCEDRCSMWHSVESRTPFSDDINLIEYVFSLPSKYKIENGKLKALMRDSMKGITPQQILDRKDKKGYKTPNRIWIAEIRNELRHVFETPAVNDYIDTKKLLKDYDKLFNQPNAQDNTRIFKLMVLPMWLGIFSGKL